MNRIACSGLKRTLLGALCASLVGLSLAGCSLRYQDVPVFSPFPIRDSVNYSAGRFKTSYMADQIHAYFRGNVSAPIAVTTFVDIDNLYGSSTFGRFISEQLMSELAMRGYNVIEIRQSEAMQFLGDQGEFGLSRDVGSLKNTFQNVSGVVVGTYAVSPINIFLNVRLIDPATSMIVSAGSVEMPKTAEIARMIRTSTLPPSLERIPVRTLGYAGYPQPYYWPAPPLPVPPQNRDTSEQMYLPEKNSAGTNLPAPAQGKKKNAPSPVIEPTT